MTTVKHCNEQATLTKKIIGDKAYDYYYCPTCHIYFKNPPLKGLDHFMQEKI